MTIYSRLYSSKFNPSPKDKNMMNSFMAQELRYYNHLVEKLTPRCKAFPETLTNLDTTWIKIFGIIAYNAVSIKKLEYAKPDVELPDCLEKYRNFLVGKDEKGRRIMDETTFSILSIASLPISLHPSVRKNIALSILEFFIDQAKIIQTAKPDRDEDIYEVCPTILQQLEFSQKRHLQLHRSHLTKIVWENSKNRTAIYHCYSKEPIYVYGKNMEKNTKWNYVIIHQQPGEHVSLNSPWYIDFMQVNSKYLVDYVDAIKPIMNNAFFIAKAK